MGFVRTFDISTLVEDCHDDRDSHITNKHKLKDERFSFGSAMFSKTVNIILFDILNKDNWKDENMKTLWFVCS